MTSLWSRRAFTQSFITHSLLKFCIYFAFINKTVPIGIPIGTFYIKQVSPKFLGWLWLFMNAQA